MVGVVFYHGWAYAEEAGLCGVSTRTIDPRWGKALLRLTRELGGRLPGGA